MRNCDFPKLINAIGFDLVQCTSWFLGKLSCFMSQEKYTLHVDHSTAWKKGSNNWAGWANNSARALYEFPSE